ncbi:MAG: glycosyltransferase family 4 protein [Lachnospiraceae bacterium]|nr:glycosyltransferase family 4 protein [Lachnospiraceae bacterium]
MHIVIVTTELAAINHSSGGLASFSANLARIFKKNGHTVSIILATTKKENIIFDKDIDLYEIFVEKSLWDKFERIAGIGASITNEEKDEIRRFFMNLYKSWRVRKVIDKIEKKKRIDIVHFCNLGALSLFADKRIPYVVRISGFLNMCNGGANQLNGNISFEDNKLSVRHRLEYFALKRAKHVISPSYFLAEIAKKNLRIRPVVIESPFVLNRADWDYSVYDALLREKRYIIHYGSLKYLKGTHIVAQMAHTILDAHSDILIVLAGADSEMFDEEGGKIKAHEFVKKAAKEHSNRVLYVGCLVREQLYPLIQNAQVCLLPSRIENLSNACIEAMAMGRIVIGTNKASFEQLIDDGVSGYLCERDNPLSYLQAVDRALNMCEEEKQMMSEKAVERIKKLAPDVVYKKYLKYYQKVIRNWNRK